MSESAQPTTPRKRRGCLRPLLILVVVVGAMALAARAFLVDRIIVPEDVTYMSPALSPGAPAWLDKLSYRISPPRRGDVVAIAAERARPGYVISRVVALPGESVAAQDGALVIDGDATAESYAHGELPPSFAAQRVSRAHYFVMPDDRSAASAGEVHSGSVPRSDIIGRVLPAGE
ncbi:MAG: signal peptidase I [Armatimonadota bacterium]|nr:MAG: signal peptidase I [Armatimonadota bacterium]